MIASLLTKIVPAAMLALASVPQALANPPTHAEPAGADEDIVKTDPTEAARLETRLVTGTRQLTFEGRRAGEGYFNPAGTEMVFQSEREPGNPFFQIYVMDLETGDVQRVSPGFGKTTCAWLHPDGNRLLFSSTHQDKQARQKQTDELKLRAEGKQRRYSWDYDPHYDVYVHDRKTGTSTNVTHTRGYDAEGSFSPDGRLIAFASNRLAYTETLSEEEQKKFEIDPAYMMDLYVMNADGTNVRRVTSEPGYDGGPFFSPDGRRICWRHFSENGATAEIMTMNVDGTDKRRLTQMGAMSWAPFYHPSGEYLIFTTNRHGFANFELYMIDTEANSAPVRVTHTAGFDGLPVFTPDGKRLAWTTRRGAAKQSQIHIADFNHAAARKLLGLDRRTGSTSAPAAGETDSARREATQASRETSPDFTAEDVRRHVEYLCREELAGRMTGTRGERLATAYVAEYFEQLGLQPAGDDGSWFQQFSFTAGAALGTHNRLAAGDRRYTVDEDWRPLAFSKTGKIEAAPVVFAGYGLTAPKTDDQEAYDSYAHLDVTDKWVLVLRYLPEGIDPKRRQHLARFSTLRYKAMLARDKKARGLIVVSGPNSKVKNQLARLRFDGSLSGSSIPVISVTDRVAGPWFSEAEENLKQLQDTLDKGQLVMGFELSGVTLSGQIDVQRIKSTGRNVLGRLAAGDQPSGQMVVIGAHVDHLGTGHAGASLAREDEKDGIHYGADDNASGTAAMLEAAQYLASLKARGKLPLKRDVVFAAWSGEELGTLGSAHFVRSMQESLGDTSEGKSHPAEEEDDQKNSIYPAVAACLNMDMVGRLEKALVLGGTGSSSIWTGEIERRNAPIGLPITPRADSYLPSDATPFYLAGVPILSAFTGSHSDYHTPRDTPDKLNYEGAARIARFVALVTRSVAVREAAPDYIKQKAPTAGRRAHLRAYLGTIPDYAESDLKGLKLSGVSGGAPADKAGLRTGDLIVELAGRKIENIYDYTYAIEALKIGQEVSIIVVRGEKRLTLKITPGSRE
ncbi:MAG: M20/M25/M40 family metallo-hydrolase [Planctomycetes bacterium]|nr:M20/M25/M40 family metallo-hydrolase [Planctomycetota bacterium]